MPLYSWGKSSSHDRENVVYTCMYHFNQLCTYYSFASSQFSHLHLHRSHGSMDARKLQKENEGCKLRDMLPVLEVCTGRNFRISPGPSTIWPVAAQARSLSSNMLPLPHLSPTYFYSSPNEARYIYNLSRPGIPNLFWMATHLTKPPRFRDIPLTVRPPPPPPPSTRLEKKIHNYIIKTNKANLTARFSYLIMSKADLWHQILRFKIYVF
jgi:hypothetical protein